MLPALSYKERVHLHRLGKLIPHTFHLYLYLLWDAKLTRKSFCLSVMLFGRTVRPKTFSWSLQAWNFTRVFFWVRGWSSLFSKITNFFVIFENSEFQPPTVFFSRFPCWDTYHEHGNSCNVTKVSEVNLPCLCIGNVILIPSSPQWNLQWWM